MMEADLKRRRMQLPRKKDRNSKLLSLERNILF